MYSLETTELKSNLIYTRITLFVSINSVQASVITECMSGIVIITDCNTKLHKFHKLKEFSCILCSYNSIGISSIDINSLWKSLMKKKQEINLKFH